MNKLMILLLVSLFVISCNENKIDDQTNEIVGVIPQEPDYNNDNMWYEKIKEGSDYDVLYFVPTCTGGEIEAESGEMCYFANINNSNTQRSAMLEKMKEGEEIFGTEANFYSPYYRQVTAESLISDEVLFTRYNTVSKEDIRDAYKFYIEHINQGRPFVLAGYSQGSMSVIAAMGVVSELEFDRLIAAYCIGCPVTPEDRKEAKVIIPAQGAGDTGVTICYNSVSRPESLPSFLSGGTFCINPVNWHTNETTAEFQTPDGDNATAHVDTENSLLIIDGLDEQKYANPATEVFPVGCYHSGELSFYANQLTENIKLRANNFLK